VCLIDQCPIPASRSDGVDSANLFSIADEAFVGNTCAVVGEPACASLFGTFGGIGTSCDDPDGDGVATDCGDNCPDEPALIDPDEVPEASCNDNVDNDCDGATDCADTDCQGGTETACADGIDNDCDGDTDCDDSDCAGDPSCAAPPIIGIYADTGCSSCSIPGPGPVQFYIRADVGALAGISGVELRVVNPDPADLVILAESVNPIAVGFGTPFSASGTQTAFPACTAGSCIDLWTILAIKNTAAPLTLTVEAFIPASNPVCPPGPAVRDCGGNWGCAVGGTAVINGPCP
jgi:hypothetical protein